MVFITPVILEEISWRSATLRRCNMSNIIKHDPPSGGFRRDGRGIKPERYMHRRLIKVDRVGIAYYLISPSIADKPIEAFSITGNESASRRGQNLLTYLYTPYAQIKQKHRTTTVSNRFSIHLGECFSIYATCYEIFNILGY